jgi:chromosome segregation ATPase
LEAQISALAKETGEIPRLKSQLESDEQRLSEICRDIDRLATAIEEEREKTASLSDQVSQLQSLIDSKQNVIDAKDGIIARLQHEYQLLQTDYERALNVYAFELHQMPTLQSLTPPRAPPRPPGASLPVALELDSSDSAPEPAQLARSCSPPPEHRMFAVPPAKPRTPRALQSSIEFLDDVPEVPVAAGDLMMSIDDVRRELQELQKERTRIEAELNRSPPKNITKAEARRAKGLLSEQYQQLQQGINRLRFELRRRRER